MRRITNITFPSFIKLLVGGFFLSTSGGHACVDLDLVNGTDKPAVLRSFSQNYSDLPVTSGMEFDPADEQVLEILIQYDRLVRYWQELREKGIVGFSEDKKDFIEITIGGDDFVIFWDQDLGAFLKKNRSDLYDADLDLIPNEEPSPHLKRRYKITFTKKPE